MHFLQKMVVVTFAMSPILFLSSCTTSEPVPPKFNVKSITECTTNTDNTLCVEEYIKGIKDEWLKNCVVSNIAEKPSLSSKMSSGSLTKDEMKDIDALMKECMYYQDTNKNHATQGYPVFSSFVSSVAGAFVGNYLANSLLSNSTGDYRNTSVADREKKYNSYSGGTYRGSAIFVG